MNHDQKIIIFLVLVPLVAILTIFMASKVNLDLSLSPTEKRLLNFNYGAIPNIFERTMAGTSSLKCPITLSKSSAKGFPETPLEKISPPSSPASVSVSATEKRVSMILINSKRKIAIIDGRLVNEGDLIDKYMISRIEKDKVLLKGKEGEKWLKIE
ncbi:MAG: hypothetical protein NTV58_19255 [Deltaproteobacteria bacterium]|nr:hypothetical protein [Deltaproteobacteria bacterium]